MIDTFFESIIADEEKLYQTELKEREEALSKANAVSASGSTNSVSTVNTKMTLHPLSLMRNVFGNYVIQLIFEEGTE